MKKTEKHELLRIPGIGPSMMKDLLMLGIERIGDLRTKDPQEMYDRLCSLTHIQMDRCVLYVFRCAVYFSNTVDPDPELLKWWNWKDKK